VVHLKLGIIDNFKEFFDKNKELNAIVATNAAAADASAIVYLDSAKITTQLTTFTQAAGTEPVLYADGTHGTTLGEFIAGSGKPKDTTSLCANLLSVRQVVQVLEAYAALGVGGSNSRVVRVGGDYQYKIHEGVYFNSGRIIDRSMSYLFIYK
jgi:hypothetical protein